MPYQIKVGNNPTWWPVSDATIIKIDANTDIAETKQMAGAIWRENITNKQYSINFIPLTKLRYGANFEVFNAEHGRR